MNPPGTGYDFVVYGQVLRLQGALLLNRVQLPNRAISLKRVLLLSRTTSLNCAILLSDGAQTSDY